MSKLLAPSNSRWTRSAFALAVVSALLLAIFTPVPWLRDRLPQWSSPSRSLAGWAEPPDGIIIQVQSILRQLQNVNTSAPMTSGDLDRIKSQLESASDNQPADCPRDEPQAERTRQDGCVYSRQSDPSHLSAHFLP